jgi:hypothetical protein
MAFDVGRGVLELVHTGLPKLIPTATEQMNKESSDE